MSVVATLERVMVGVLWTLVVLTVGYCWLDMVLRLRSAAYRKLADTMDREGTRWRYVLLAVLLLGAVTETVRVFSD